MKRDLSYAINFGDDEEFRLVRDMALVECDDDGFAEEFVVEDMHHGVHFTPAELAELHEAIHEMLRKGDELKDVLTDGEAPPIAAPYRDTAEPDEASLAILKALADRDMLYLEIGEERIKPLIDARLIEIDTATPGMQKGVVLYIITDKGRAALAEEEE